MKGFNYATQAAFDLSVAQLREELQGIVDNGGFRRVENGETFAHGSDGVIIWEAYGNVPAAKSRGRKEARQSAGNYGSLGNAELFELDQES